MKQIKQTTKATKTREHRTRYLIVSTISMLFAGIIYAWSILKSPLGEEFGWTPSMLALNFTITISFFCIGGLISGLALRRISLNYVLIAAAVLVSLGFILSSVISGQIILLYLFYGILAGTGIGIAYNALLSATNSWFPDKKGLSSGVQMMAFGASSLVLGNIAGALIELPSFGWRNTFIVLGVSTGIVLLAASFIIKFPDKDTVLPAPKSGGKSGSEESETVHYTTVEMIKRPSFWKFFLFSITMAAIGNTVISLARDLALSVGAGAALATTLVGVLSIFNGLGRLIAGGLFDSIGRRGTMVVGNLVTIVAPILVLISILTSSLVVCIIGLCLTGISYGFCPPISSAFVMSFYGTKSFPMNFSVANTMLIPTSFVATFAGSMITATGSFTSTFIMLIGLAVCSLLLNISIKRP